MQIFGYLNTITTLYIRVQTDLLFEIFLYQCLQNVTYSMSVGAFQLEIIGPLRTVTSRLILSCRQFFFFFSVSFSFVFKKHRLQTIDFFSFFFPNIFFSYFGNSLSVSFIFSCFFLFNLWLYFYFFIYFFWPLSIFSLLLSKSLLLFFSFCLWLLLKVRFHCQAKLCKCWYVCIYTMTVMDSCDLIRKITAPVRLLVFLTYMKN